MSWFGKRPDPHGEAARASEGQRDRLCDELEEIAARQAFNLHEFRRQMGPVSRDDVVTLVACLIPIIRAVVNDEVEGNDWLNEIEREAKANGARLDADITALEDRVGELEAPL